MGSFLRTVASMGKLVLIGCLMLAWLAQSGGKKTLKTIESETSIIREKREAGANRNVAEKTTGEKKRNKISKNNKDYSKTKGKKEKSKNGQKKKNNLKKIKSKISTVKNRNRG